jgi:hypothetical protein
MAPAAVKAIKLARFGEFKRPFFQSEYEDKVRRHGERYARRRAYQYAPKTLFFASRVGKASVDHLRQIGGEVKRGADRRGEREGKQF